MNIKIVVLLLLLLTNAGCSTHRPQLQLAPGAGNVQVAKSDPGDNFEMIGPVSGFDGAKCGGFGYVGIYERAITSLRNRTYEMGGSYAQLISVSEPLLSGDCFVNTYVIRATAFKKVRDKPSPTQIEDASEEKLTKKLRELKKMLDDGVLTEQEYKQQKTKLLDKGF